MSDYDAEQKRLSDLFDLVKPESHWKDKINAVVPFDADLTGIREAVIHFTGSVPTFQPVMDGDKQVYCVFAAGYWATIGG